MTDTTTRPLPTNEKMLSKHYLPARPAVDAYGDARRAVARLRADVQSRLTEVDEVDAAGITDLVDSAIAGDPLDDLMDDTAIARVRLQHRLHQLDRAGDAISSRAARAEHTDPELIAWRERREAIWAAWREAMAADTDAERFTQLTQFAARH